MEIRSCKFPKVKRMNKMMPRVINRMMPDSFCPPCSKAFLKNIRSRLLAKTGITKNSKVPHQ